MEQRELYSTSLTNGVVVRSYLPLGRYLAGTFRHRNALFHASDRQAFSVIRVLHPTPEHYESPWSFPDEVRLLAALALSSNIGCISAYPSQSIFLLDDGVDDITKPSLVDQVKEAMRSHPSPATDATVYGFCGKIEYDLLYSGIALSRADTLYRSIDPSDGLMMRGLGALLKGPLLARHYTFHTESCVSLHIAMEASGEIVRRRLRAQGKSDSYVDAGDHIAKAFGEEARGLRYFAAFYEDRIKTIHPVSRFGEFSDPGLAADDFWDLLRESYCRLRLPSYGQHSRRVLSG